MAPHVRRLASAVSGWIRKTYGNNFLDVITQMIFEYFYIKIESKLLNGNEQTKLMELLVDKLKRQRKRADTESIHNHLIKILPFQNTLKEALLERIDFLTTQGKIVNKINQNKDSFWVNEDLVDMNCQLSISNLHNFSLTTPTISRSNCLHNSLNIASV